MNSNGMAVQFIPFDGAIGILPTIHSDSFIGLHSFSEEVSKWVSERLKEWSSIIYRSLTHSRIRTHSYHTFVFFWFLLLHVFPFVFVHSVCLSRESNTSSCCCALKIISDQVYLSLRPSSLLHPFSSAQFFCSVVNTNTMWLRIELIALNFDKGKFKTSLKCRCIHNILYTGKKDT